MPRNVVVCARFGGNNFEVSYGVDCSRDQKGKGNWKLALVCNYYGYLVTIARSEGSCGEN
jgi:hypothetical protein